MCIDSIIIIGLLIVLIVMTAFDYKRFKGISDALETSRLQMDKLIVSQSKLEADMSQLTDSLRSTMTILKDIIEQFAEVTKTLGKINKPFEDLSHTVSGDNPKSKQKEVTIADEVDTRRSTFFAKAYDETDRLVVEAKNAANASATMPFRVTAEGNKGTIDFNSESYAETAKNMQVLVFPFCDVEMKIGGSPQGIINIESGIVTLTSGAWVITKKPRIKII